MACIYPFLIVCILLFLLLFFTTAWAVQRFFRHAILGKRYTVEEQKSFWKRKMTDAQYATLCQKINYVNNKNCEDAWIVSEDGLRLHASVYAGKTADAVTIIGMHGWRSSGLFDFAVISEWYLQQGYRVILPDQRAHGKSEGKYATFGVWEEKDLMGWISYAKQTGAAKILLHGVSMGATTILFASGREDLPHEVCGVIADCGFVSAYDEFSYLFTSMPKILSSYLLRCADAVSRRRAGFSFSEKKTEQALEHSDLPFLFFHGEDDDFVPLKFSRNNFEHCKSAKKLLITVPMAKHAMSSVTDPRLYVRSIDHFVRELLM